MTVTMEATCETFAQKMQEEAIKRIESLPEEVTSDLMELVSLLNGEDDPNERKEISKTIMEIIFPNSIKAAVLQDERLIEETAARERLNEYRRRVGTRIREAREAAGITQDALAELAGIPQSHVCRLELGKHAPTFTTMERLAKALGTTPGQLDPGFEK